MTNLLPQCQWSNPKEYGKTIPICSDDRLYNHHENNPHLRWQMICNEHQTTSTLGDVSVDKRYRWNIWIIRVITVFLCVIFRCYNCRSKYLYVDTKVNKITSFVAPLSFHSLTCITSMFQYSHLRIMVILLNSCVIKFHLPTELNFAIIKAVWVSEYCIPCVFMHIK